MESLNLIRFIEQDEDCIIKKKRKNKKKKIMKNIFQMKNKSDDKFEEKKKRLDGKFSHFSRQKWILKSPINVNGNSGRGV